MRPSILAAALAAVFTLTALCTPYTPTAAAGEDAAAPIPMKGWTIIPEEPEVELTPEDHFRLGEESYDFGEYEAAREHYESALDELKDDRQRAKCFERLAFIYAAFGLNDEVYAAFAESLRLDPSLVLDPDLVSPKVYDFYARARNDVVREGTLVVNSDPPGAGVYLNGESVGQAPVKVEHVSEGEYVLEVRKRGYETSSGNVAIKKDVTLTVDEKLGKARGVLRVTSRPPGVSAEMDGEAVGVTPLVIENVSGGGHTLVLTRPSFERYEAAVTLEKGGDVSHDALMTRRVLVVPVDMVEQGAVRRLIEPGLTSLDGLELIYTDMDALKLDLTGRGLPSESLGFVGECKRCLDLGETAVISGLLESSRAELAIVVAHLRSVDESGAPTETLKIALYSTASELADVVVHTSPTRDGLSKGVWRFVDAWNGVYASDESVYGMRAVDRDDGSVRVLDVLSGYPASEAGIAAGMRILKVDGSEVGTVAELNRLTDGGAVHEFELKDDGRPLKAELSPVRVQKEAPLDSGTYLYNLALVDLAAYVNAAGDAGVRHEDGDGLSYAALSLGNVYRRFGMMDKALGSYRLVNTSRGSGVCTGTALFRMAEAYEAKGLWPEAADAYRRSMMLYPEATVSSSDGPRIKSMAVERLKRMYRLGLLRDRWWL